MWENQSVLNSKFSTNILCTMWDQANDEGHWNYRNFIFKHLHGLEHIQRLIKDCKFEDKAAIEKNGSRTGIKGNQWWKVKTETVQRLSQWIRQIYQATLQRQKDRVKSSLRENQSRNQKEFRFWLEIAWGARERRHRKVEGKFIPNKRRHQHPWVNAREFEQGNIFGVERSRVWGFHSKL